MGANEHKNEDKNSQKFLLCEIHSKNNVKTVLSVPLRGLEHAVSRSAGILTGFRKIILICRMGRMDNILACRQVDSGSRLVRDKSFRDIDRGEKSALRRLRRTRAVRGSHRLVWKVKVLTQKLTEGVDIRSSPGETPIL